MVFVNSSLESQKHKFRVLVKNAPKRDSKKEEKKKKKLPPLHHNERKRYKPFKPFEVLILVGVFCALRFFSCKTEEKDTRDVTRA